MQFDSIFYWQISILLPKVESDKLTQLIGDPYVPTQEADAPHLYRNVFKHS